MADVDRLQNEPIVALQAVSKRFGTVTAVDAASMAIEPGEFFSLLGPSGCGKSTILRLVAGFEQPDSGRILLEGRDVAGVPPYRRNVHMVFQQYALFPHLSAFENVAFGPRARGMARGEIRERVGRMLEVVRMGQFAARRPDQLSGGQRQRLALARALVGEPAAVLLDEPLSALDLQLRRDMHGELQRIQRETGIAFVLVTHDQEEAWTLSHRTAVMRDGRIEQIGTPREIYASPANMFVAGFIGSAVFLPVTVLAKQSREWTVRIGSADVAMPAPPHTPESAEVRMMIRPECVQLSAQPPPADPQRVTLHAALEEVTFQGPHLRCRLRTSDGNAIVSLVDAASATPALHPGLSMWTSWHTSDARLLRTD